MNTSLTLGNRFSGNIPVAVEQLGWALLHSLWQIAFVALVTHLILRGMRRAPASVRYSVLVAAMGVSVVIPIVIWSIPSDDSLEALSHEAHAAPQPTVEVKPATSPPIRPERSELITRSEIHDSTEVRTAVPDNSIQITGTWRDEMRENLRPWLSWIVMGWFVGVALCSLRPLLGWRTLRRLRRIGLSPVSNDIKTTMMRISESFGVRCAVDVVQSTVVQVPVVVGYLRPMILLPVCLMTSITPTQLETILAHELAHIRRHDFAVNLIQTLIETLFFYHPAIWWLSNQVRIEREHCCDDLVVKSLGNRIEYGRALLAIAEQRGSRNVLALGASDGSLLSRVKRIFGDESDASNTRLKDRSPVGLLCLFCLSAILAVGFISNCLARSGSETSSHATIAQLPDGITVELVGVGFHPSKDRQWWKPDGSPLVQRPQVDGENTSMNNSPEQAKCREFWLQIRGLSPNQQSVWTDYGVNAATGSSCSEVLWVGKHSAGPFKSKTTSIRVGLTTELFGPVMTIDTLGKKQAIGELPEELKVYYDRIVPLRSEEASGQTELILSDSPLDGLHKLAAWELYAIDVAGKKHFDVAQSVSIPGERRFSFKLPRERIAQFECRLRPYQHWVTFDNVSLEPGKTTDVKVAIKSSPDRKVQYDTAAMKPLECEVVDKLTGKLVEGATVRFKFYRWKWPQNRQPDGSREPVTELVFRNVGKFQFQLPAGLDVPANYYLQRTEEHPDYETKGAAGLIALDKLISGSKHERDWVQKVELSPGKLVTGQVLDLDGTPAHGVVVNSGRNRQGWQNGYVHQTVTDADGRFRLIVPAGRDRGRIYLIPNHAAAVSRAITPEYGEQAVFQLRPGTRVFGTVKDAEGHGLAGIVVRANAGERVPWRYAVTDAEGRYSLLPCQYGSYTFDLADSGQLPAVFLPQKRELSKSDTSDQSIDFEPVESVRVTARMLTADDRPEFWKNFTTTRVEGWLRVHSGGNVDASKNNVGVGISIEPRLGRSTVSSKQLNSLLGEDRVTNERQSNASLRGNKEPDSMVGWSGRFREVPAEVGLYELHVPKGLNGRINRHPFTIDGHFLRIIDRRPNTYFEEEKGDASFVVRRVKASKVTLRTVFNGQPLSVINSVHSSGQFVDPEAARRLGAEEATSGWSFSKEGEIRIDVHPDLDVTLMFKYPGFVKWEQTLKLGEGEDRVISVPLREEESGASAPIPGADDPQAQTGDAVLQ